MSSAELELVASMVGGGGPWLLASVAVLALRRFDRWMLAREQRDDAEREHWKAEESMLSTICRSLSRPVPSPYRDADTDRIELNR